MRNNSRTVLVIDDDVMIGELMAAIIDSEEYRAVIATTGVEGVQLAQTISPAVIFCDFSMPGMSGEAVLNSLRADPRTARIPLILMSGHAPFDLNALGADAFLQKPFNLNEVLPLIGSLLPAHHECAVVA